jgi:5-formyltetrahydrofolate cyclo-ligase
MTDIATRKRAWRDRVLLGRASLPSDVRSARAAALVEQIVELAAGVNGPVCGYLPFGTEPGSIAWLEALQAVEHEVLLPVVRLAAGPLDWARYHGPDALRRGQLGLLEPTTPTLGPEAAMTAKLVLVPALAADRQGVRLGRGGGYYDRTLSLVASDTSCVVVLNPEELVDELPAEEHDRRVAAALLAGTGLVPLGPDGAQHPAPTRVAPREQRQARVEQHPE